MAHHDAKDNERNPHGHHHGRTTARAGERQAPPTQYREAGTDRPAQVDSRDVAPSVDLDDRALLEALAGGDLGAMRKLYDRHAPWLSVRLARRCNDREVVADVLQDTFVAVWRGAERFRGTGEVGAWMWGIAIRRLVSRLRLRRDVVPMADPLRRGRTSEVTLEDELLACVEYGDLGGALASLSPDLRAAIQATVLDGLTIREAATLLGIPAGTVKTRVHRAKAHLRASLVEGGPR